MRVALHLRTNYWQTGADGAPKDWISFKIDSRALDELPAPRPLVEIFVYSPRMEGIHLRGGRVARGGIRWSDRREDFRTEVLGLMKTQMVKNAVIVPVGSKGGFYVKQPPSTHGRRHARAGQAEGIDCYQTLIRGLLDITDNYAGGGVRAAGRRRAPRRRRSLSRGRRRQGHRHLLRHRQCARPGLRLLARRCLRLGRLGRLRPQEDGHHRARRLGIGEAPLPRARAATSRRTPFTVVGVGDMSGDVFGNGMLLSQHIKLLAAFDHRHIFIDPMPDPATSWAERKRLFDLPRSSWMDYDKSLLSAGGGIYDRAAKSIALSAEARAGAGHRGADHDAGRPDARHPDGAGRPALFRRHRHLREGVEREPRRCRRPRQRRACASTPTSCARAVIGEGANLGFTQRGRVEAALAGRKINTDALDNSAGVDTSDHEVNIKIATGEAISRGLLARADRDPLLFSMTDEVAALVLRHNYQQSQAISVAADAGGRGARPAGALHARAGAPGPARPRRRVPARHGGDARARARTASISRGPSSRCCWPTPRSTSTTRSWSPTCPTIRCSRASCCATSRRALQEKYEPAIRAHRLRREIAALQVVNSLVNRCGPTFVRNVGLRTGAPAAAIARAFAVVRDAWKLRDLWGDIEALDPALKAEAQIRMLVASQRFLTRVVQWTLRRLPQPLDTMAATEQLGAAVAALGDLPAGADRRGRKRGAGRARGGLRGDGRAGRHRPPRRSARDPGRRRRPDAGGPRQRLQHRGGDPRSISAWASGCRSPAWRRRRRSCRARASGRRRPPSPCRTSSRPCMPIC